MSDLRDELAKFADLPMKQTEYKILEIVRNDKTKERIDELHKAFDLGYIPLEYWQKRMAELQEGLEL